jgi:hypothetical protein
LKTIFLVLDHGLGLGYFFETEVTRLLLEKNIRIVFLVQDSILPHIKGRIDHPNVVYESMRDGAVREYQNQTHPGKHELMDYARRASAKHTIPLTYVDTHRKRKEYEAFGRRKLVLRALRPIIFMNRYSKIARHLYRKSFDIFLKSDLYGDLFDKYQPDLIISNTAGWRLDQYLMREAQHRGIKTATVIIGWDNPSSQGLPGAYVDYANVWSEVHKWELVEGIDWPADKVHVGGMPLYDGYISGKWRLSREDYFNQHHLDPNKKLIAFAATALSITPNLHIIKILAEMVDKQVFSEPAQLLIRLHPNHFKSQQNYRDECAAIMDLVEQYPDVHVVEPRAVGSGIERYSGDDFPEKASMLSHCDVLATIYSTMVVEAALHDKPFISVCINTDEGWGKDKFWIPLDEVPGWPTAARVNQACAGKTVITEEELRFALNEYLAHPELDREERLQFAKDELTYLNGEATQSTVDFISSLLEG